MRRFLSVVLVFAFMVVFVTAPAQAAKREDVGGGGLPIPISVPTALRAAETAAATTVATSKDPAAVQAALDTIKKVAEIKEIQVKTADATVTLYGKVVAFAAAAAGAHKGVDYLIDKAVDAATKKAKQMIE